MIIRLNVKPILDTNLRNRIESLSLTLGIDLNIDSILVLFGLESSRSSSRFKGIYLTY